MKTSIWQRVVSLLGGTSVSYPDRCACGARMRGNIVTGYRLPELCAHDMCWLRRRDFVVGTAAQRAALLASLEHYREVQK